MSTVFLSILLALSELAQETVAEMDDRFMTTKLPRIVESRAGRF
jgi:hypothetical protein